MCLNHQLGILAHQFSSQVKIFDEEIRGRGVGDISGTRNSRRKLSGVREEYIQEIKEWYSVENSLCKIRIVTGNTAGGYSSC